MITQKLNLDQQAKRAQQELFMPIKKLNGFLRGKLRGCYKSAKLVEWTKLSMRGTTLDDKFPGICRIRSKDGGRELEMRIKFDWHKWGIIKFHGKMEDAIEFDAKDPDEKFEKCGILSLKALDNEVFISHLRNWLKTGEKMPWEKYEAKLNA